MRKLLLMLLGFFIFIFFTRCGSLSNKQEAFDQQRDSLIKSRNIIDSLIHSKAILFSKGLLLEKDSVAGAIAIYKGLSQDKTGDFYSVEARNRMFYLGARKFLETIRVANADSISREEYFNRFPGYSVDSFLTYFSKGNFDIYDADADEKKEVSYKIDELRKELTARSGHAFNVIAQMGYFYSAEYATYPDAGFPIYTEYGRDTYVVLVGNCRLTFLFNDEGVYRLRRIENWYLTDK